MAATIASLVADMMDGDDAGWIVMMLGMLLLWGLVIFGVVALVRHFSGPGDWRGSPGLTRSESAIEVLDRRFAQGEISADEYRERRSVLSGHLP